MRALVFVLLLLAVLVAVFGSGYAYAGVEALSGALQAFIGLVERAIEAGRA